MDAVEVARRSQRIPDVGLSLKIILDNFPQLKVIVTGSSSLDLASKISEPLTGRAYFYKLFPISQLELTDTLTHHENRSQLEERLIFGSYPEVFSLDAAEAKKNYLINRKGKGMSEHDDKRGEPIKITDGLYIGNLRAARNIDALTKKKITHILTVADGIEPEWPKVPLVLFFVL